MDLLSVAGFDWDAGNIRKNDRHGVSNTEVEEVFFRHTLVVPDPRHSAREPRYHALARIDDGRTLHVTFTLRERAGKTLVRVISARVASRAERKVYEQGQT